MLLFTRMHNPLWKVTKFQKIFLWIKHSRIRSHVEWFLILLFTLQIYTISSHIVRFYRFLKTFQTIYSVFSLTYPPSLCQSIHSVEFAFFPVFWYTFYRKRGHFNEGKRWNKTRSICGAYCWSGAWKQDSKQAYRSPVRNDQITWRTQCGTGKNHQRNIQYLRERKA